MNQLDERDLDTHVKIVGWLYIVSSAVCLVLAVLAFVFFAGIGLFTGDAQALGILSVIGVVGGLLFTVLGVPGIIAGAGLLGRKSWARILTIVLSILNLVNVPVGTLIGIYALWVLMQESATPYFAMQSPAG